MNRRIGRARRSRSCLLGAACSTPERNSANGGGSGSGSASGEPIIIGFPADLTTDWAYYDSPMQEGRSSPSTRSTRAAASSDGRSN